MNLDEAVKCLAELGHATRLRFFRLLVRSGQHGLAVGEAQRCLGIPASTLSHHIAHLVSAGLVRQQREGRVLRCYPCFEVMDALVGFMTDECCTGIDSAGRRSAPHRGARAGGR